MYKKPAAVCKGSGVVNTRIRTGGDYGLSLPHFDTGIWLRYETFLPNWLGRVAHQR